MGRPVTTIIALAIGLVFASAPVAVAQSTSLGDLSASFQSLSERVTPSVVQVFAIGYGPPPDNDALLSKQRSTGSGVILDAGGYIITNAHVVQGARRVQVMIPFTKEEQAQKRSILKQAGRVVGAQIVGTDLETDLAVLKVQAKDLPALDIADSDQVQQGQIVLAFGSPFGLENSVSMGVVSSVARQLGPDAPVVYIQTDATINPGNSGGPLVNASGKLVGINTMIYSQSGGSEGIGFALPSNIVRNVYQQIRASGRVRRGEIGVHAQTITPLMARGLGLSKNWGVILGDVYPGGPAHDAGLRIGDIVVSLDGKPMENGRQLDVNVYRRNVGEEVEVAFIRGEESRRVKVKVVERPDDPDRFVDLVHRRNNLVPKLGILAVNIDRRIAALLPELRSSDGVVVAAQSADSPSWRDRFQPGDVIVAVNGQAVGSIERLREISEALLTGDPVVVQIQRGPRMQFIEFEME